MGRIEEVQEGEEELVKELQLVEDEHLLLEQEMQRKLFELELRYTQKQQPLLERRKEMLCEGNGNGTSALKAFWLEAFLGHIGIDGLIQEHDKPVLEHLVDVTSKYNDESDANKGFSVHLHFSANPYFEETVLSKTYCTNIESPFNGSLDVEQISASPITWKSGKDVTMEKVTKKSKKGKTTNTVESRESFFRDWFRTLSPTMTLSDEAREFAEMLRRNEEESDEDDDDEEDDEQLIARLMEADHSIASALKDDVIPRAIRFYTREATPEMDDDDDFEEDEEEDTDDDSEDDSPSPKGRGKRGKGGVKGKTDEQCKQQ